MVWASDGIGGLTAHGDAGHPRGYCSTATEVGCCRGVQSGTATRVSIVAVGEELLRSSRASTTEPSRRGPSDSEESLERRLEVRAVAVNLRPGVAAVDVQASRQRRDGLPAPLTGIVPATAPGPRHTPASRA